MRKKDYGKIPIQRNWNRMAELSEIRNKTSVEKAEYTYRISVQNYFAGNGKMPDNYIPVGTKPTEISP